MQNDVSSSSIPGKKMDFLCDSKYKTELFAFLTDYNSKLKLHLDNLFNKVVPQIAASLDNRTLHKFQRLAVNW